MGEIVAKAKEIAYNAMGYVKQVVPPCLLGTRGHLQPLWGKKKRIIYNAPAEIALLEQTFVAPLLKKCKDMGEACPIMFGKNVIPRLSRMNMASEFPGGSYAVELDISGFDKGILAAFELRAFGILEALLDFDHWKGKKLCPSAARRYQRVWDFCVEYVIHTPVMTPDGKCWFLDGSIASGSSFTQLVESILSMLYAEYYAITEANPILDLKVLGDDCRMVLARFPDMTMIARIYKTLFGAVVNVEKTKVRKADRPGSEFLGYHFERGFLRRDREEWFRMMLNTEYPVKSLEVSFSRLTAYMFLGGVNDRKFTDFMIQYQRCYELKRSWKMSHTRDLKAKMNYGGLELPDKRLLEYTMSDYMWSLITFK